MAGGGDHEIERTLETHQETVPYKIENHKICSFTGLQV